ncbi:exodeoxyribonuclease VII large subunit [Robertmurraya massiliosenegalensis]|uniref:exodeoxyribonuclease VII large subunit n=1 Tax=Robertmurraya massiliosenegalensis TaxID=1287657 RepID=UPI0003039477|nr:exodeoxyribonuclease VII large subunit [Robertmurraya massiliosenegalensis]
MKEKRYLTVAALTKYIKRKFDADPHLQGVLVKGEISNFKQHSSGHMYFTLKDEKARILAVMFSSDARSMKFVPENGMKVLISGNITVYEQSGQYQIYVKSMQPDGIGALYLAYEQLKEKLEKEGLFSPTHKKPIPKYPRTIGVITSPTGAAVRDILTTIQRRYPIAHILIIPAVVQGDQAKNSIVNAIKKANELGEIDCLIVGRGGGSIEELWGFNEEIVARAIYTSEIPIISAVGHETDFTIADFVADMRAPTPTGAAELAVPHVDELMERILTRQARLVRVIKERVQLSREKLNRIERSYAFRYPRRAYEQKMEQVDKATERLVKGAEKHFLAQKEVYLHLNRRIERHKPRELLKEAMDARGKLEKQMNRVMTAILADKQKDFRQMLMTLEALSPLKVMDRGYSLVYDNEGKLSKSVAQFSKEDELTVQMADGSIQCKVLDVEEKENQ